MIGHFLFYQKLFQSTCPETCNSLKFPKQLFYIDYTLADKAFPYPDFHGNSGIFMLTGNDIIPCQCVVIDCDTSWYSVSLRVWLKNKLIERRVVRTLRFW